jgi:hypothetical protein
MYHGAHVSTFLKEIQIPWSQDTLVLPGCYLQRRPCFIDVTVWQAARRLPQSWLEKNSSFIHSQARIVQDGSLALLSGFLNHTHGRPPLDEWSDWIRSLCLFRKVSMTRQSRKYRSILTMYRTVFVFFSAKVIINTKTVNYAMFYGLDTQYLWLYRRKQFALRPFVCN